MAEETYKRLRKNPLKVVGKTHGNRPVVGGFFALVDGQGLPLDIVLYYFKDHDLIPDWLGFFMESIERGWNPRSTLTKIETACQDVYGKLHSEEVVDALVEMSGC
jgi:hypothetical protein